MSDVQIPNLPAASTLSGQEQIEVVQFGVSVRASTSQILDLFTLPVASNALPTMNSTASAGTSINYSRGDHIHPTDTSRYAASNPAGYQTAAQVTATLVPYALIDSQVFTGTPSLPTGTVGVTQTTADSSLKLATTAFVKAQGYAPTSSLGTMSTQNANSVAITGGAINGTTVGATTPSTGSFTNLTSSGTVSGAGFTALLSTYAKIDSQAFTGTPSLPTGTTGVTQTALNNSTKLATTAYVDAASTALGLGTMATQNANAVAITGGSINNTAVGATTRSTGAFTTLAANGAATFTSSLTASPASANVVLSPTGTGVVTIAPATLGTINNMSVGATTPSTGAFTTLVATSINSTPIGATTPSTGAFTTLSATGTATFTGALTASPANASVTLLPTGTGTVTINPATLGNINNMNIGATTAAAGTFTNLTATGTVGGTGFTNLLTPYALVNSQVFTGTPSLPTGTIGVTQVAATNNTTLATTAYVKSQNYLTANQTITHTGDVTGSGTTSIANTVVQLQGRPLSASLPATGNLMGWNGTTWGPVAAGAAAAGGSPNQIQYNNGGVLGGIATTGTFAGSSVVMSIAPTFANSIAITSAAGASSITMSKFTGAFGNLIIGQRNALNRWALQIGSTATETGTANTGSDFTLDRYDDTGAIIDRPLSIARTDGKVTFTTPIVTAGITTQTHTISGGALGGVLGNTLTPLVVGVTDTNADQLRSEIQRTAAGTDWTTAAWQLYRQVDAVKMGYMEFNSGSVKPIAFGKGTTEFGSFDTNGNLLLNRNVTQTFANVSLNLNKTASGQNCIVMGQMGGLGRWVLNLGEATAEGGSNAGSDFSVVRYTDAGAVIDSCFKITRSSGNALFTQALTSGAHTVNGAITSTGNYTINAASATITLNKPAAGTAVSIFGQTNALNRWQLALGGSGAEGGSNAGSDFAINSYNDAGTLLTTPLSINRATGVLSVLQANIAGGTVLYRDSIELGAPAQNAGAFVDFHSGAYNNDFDARIISTGGAAAPGNGSLQILAAGVSTTGQFQASGNVQAGSGLVSTGGTIYLESSGAENFINVSDASLNGGQYRNISIRGLDGAGSAEAQIGTIRLHAATVYCTGAINTVGAISATGQIYTAGRMDAVGAYTSRAGVGGGASNPFSFYWNGANLYAYVDSSQLGYISIVSDYRTKKDVAPLLSMWDRVKTLNPISYTQKEFTPPIEIEKKTADELEADGPMFIADDTERWGFVAHELQAQLIGSAATGVKDDPACVQSPNPWTVIAALTKALQEAMARIEALEARA